MRETKPKKKILVVRNDKLGDFMLAYPSFAMLKTNMPDCLLYALVPGYTREMADACPWIDHVLIDPEPGANWRSAFSLAKVFKREKFDAIISLYSTTRVGLAAKWSGIPFRLAPATKVTQVFYNFRLTQRRSHSKKPEYQYNKALTQYFLSQHNIHPIKQPDAPYLQFNPEEIELKKRSFCDTYQINSDMPLVFVHCGSGGSAKNLSIEQFSNLTKHLRLGRPHVTVLTSGPEDGHETKKLGRLLSDKPHVIFESKKGLLDFAKHIQFADLFISGSTGPLHIAGALDVPTAAFYPLRKSATALRWQTLNHPKKRLSFSPIEGEPSGTSLNINVTEAAKVISEAFLKTKKLR